MCIGTVLLQRERHFKSAGLHENSRKLFIDHLSAFVSKLLASGHEVMLAADMNEHCVNGHLAKALRSFGVIES